MRAAFYQGARLRTAGGNGGMNHFRFTPRETWFRKEPEGVPVPDVRRSVELTRRENSMLVELVNSGETDKTIAFALGITTGTLKVYWTRMRQKLRYLTGKDMNRTQIALWAERSGGFAGAAIIPQSNSEGEAL